jgi:phage portal protein BeeE
MSTGDSFNDSSQLNMAASFKSRNTALSAEQLRNARETRAQEALRMKDEQLRILAEQNAALHSSLDKVLYLYKTLHVI